jgi:hypothetical protein
LERTIRGPGPGLFPRPWRIGGWIGNHLTHGDSCNLVEMMAVARRPAVY